MTSSAQPKARPKALLIMGGDAYHNKEEHYEELAGLFAGPCGLNITITDDLPGQTKQSLSAYDLLVLWTTLREPPAEPVNALFDTVRAGTPLYGIHAAPYTVRMIEGGPAAIGGSYQKTFPHLPYQETTVRIYEKDHPVTRGIEDFSITDELYCIDEITPDTTVLAGYDGREARSSRAREGQPPDPRHELGTQWRLQQPRAPLIWTKPLGKGQIVVNALGHDGQAIANPSFRRLTAQAARWLTGAS
jgi:type 1 glutamine amidotransferase